MAAITVGLGHRLLGRHRAEPELISNVIHTVEKYSGCLRKPSENKFTHVSQGKLLNLLQPRIASIIIAPPLCVFSSWSSGPPENVTLGLETAFLGKDEVK